MNILDLDTPCYIANVDVFSKNVKDLTNAYKKHYDNVRFGYSYKTNYYVPFLEEIRNLGEYAEVVSDKEYELAKSIGHNDGSIIYNGVIPDYSKIDAIKSNAIVNIENLYELKSMYEQYKFDRIGIRVCFNVENDIISRFGFYVGSKEYEEMKEFVKDNDIKVDCVHCHISQARDARNFAIRIKNMINVANELNADSIDIGGNMFGRINDESFLKQFDGYTTYEEYGEVVGSEMRKAYPNCEKTLILEGGTPVVSDAVKIAFSVIAVKEICGKTFIIVDGRLNDAGFSCMFKQPPYKHYGKKENFVKNAYVVGCSCMEEDYIIKDYNGYANVGDKIVISNVGAYSSNIVNDFISYGCRTFYNEKHIDYGEDE